MRQSKWQWFSRFFPFAPSAPKPRRQKGPAKPPLRRTWIVLGQRFVAATKSEARALAKKAMGHKDRLPVGTVVVEEKKAE